MQSRLNNVSYHYERTEEFRTLSLSKCPVLLLLHGYTGSSQNWQLLLPGLTPHFQIIAPDILGHAVPPAPRIPPGLPHDPGRCRHRRPARPTN
ncbi:MAG: alpha/beta hydrolase [Chloroflexi bacterium]|nr:alpha/beta hydrolase [Chloroflexota bacterium]